MTDPTPRPSKPALTETAVARKIDAAVEEVLEKVKVAEDAREAATRKSIAAKAVTASIDISEKYPLGSLLIGVVIIAGSLVGSLGFLDGMKLYIGVGVGCGIGVSFVPGLARKVVGLAGGLAKAKKESQ